MSFIIHTLLETIRLDALLSYHNCLAGGGHDHQAIEKIKASLNEKFYLPKMYNDITLYVRSCHRGLKIRTMACGYTRTYNKDKQRTSVYLTFC